MKKNEPTQMECIYALMRDGHWRTLPEIREYLGKGLDTSISARIRDLRKPTHGSHEIQCRNRNHIRGLYEYRLVPDPILIVDEMLKQHPMLGDIHPYMTGKEPRIHPQERGTNV
jgi:hypothetical protein